MSQEERRLMLLMSSHDLRRSPSCNRNCAMMSTAWCWWQRWNKQDHQDNPVFNHRVLVALNLNAATVAQKDLKLAVVFSRWHTGAVQHEPFLINHKQMSLRRGELMKFAPCQVADLSLPWRGWLTKCWGRAKRALDAHIHSSTPTSMVFHKSSVLEQVSIMELQHTLLNLRGRPLCSSHDATDSNGTSLS